MALAGTIKYPEVIPGPGLPSLESLGLTSAQLWNMPLLELAGGAKSLTARWNGQCSLEGRGYTNVEGLVACYHYLNSLGTTRCGMPSFVPRIQMCESGDARVYGYTMDHRKEVSSYCSDVAIGLLWVINSCTRPDQSCAGDAPAWGNGDLDIKAGDVSYF